jgi:hypothetical protein
MLLMMAAVAAEDCIVEGGGITGATEVADVAEIAEVTAGGGATGGIEGDSTAGRGGAAVDTGVTVTCLVVVDVAVIVTVVVDEFAVDAATETGETGDVAGESVIVERYVVCTAPAGHPSSRWPRAWRWRCL